jgi:predicted DCC family thiol-disulfide oxidoreductase YuxK
MNKSAKLKVYYNSACPVCKAGIEGQMTKESVCDIQWNDVHNNNGLVADVNSELELVRERLHVIDEKGELQIGFHAFLAIWRNSPTEKWKATVFGLPLLKQLGSLAYNLFATVLYRWNKVKKHW